MTNELLDVSINTMIGLLPSIINYNNSLINEEFKHIVDNNKIILDVSSNNIHSHNGDFDILTIGGLTIVYDNILSTLQKISSLDSSISELYQTINNTSSITYGSNLSASPISETISLFDNSVSDSVNQEYDFSSFFSTGGKGKVSNIVTSLLYKKSLYRILDGIKIPLSIGTIIVGGKLRMMIYHDHIDNSGSKTIAQRVYVAVVNGSDGNSIQQYGSASTINIGSKD